MNKRELADKLRTLREQRGLTQPELARSCHVGQSQISRWENATAIPSSPKLDGLAHALGVDVAELSSWILEATEDELTRVRRDRDNLVDYMRQHADMQRQLVTRLAELVDRLEQQDKRSAAQS